MDSLASWEGSRVGLRRSALAFLSVLSAGIILVVPYAAVQLVGASPRSVRTTLVARTDGVADANRPSPERAEPAAIQASIPRSSPRFRAAPAAPRPKEPAPQPIVAASAPATPSPCRSSTKRIVNVKDFGAKGDDARDDSAAIQRANNSVAKGGGRVVFPKGTFRAVGIEQDSCVAFVAQRGTALVHPNGTSPSAIVAGRVTDTMGSITEGSRTLEVADQGGAIPGAMVAIRGAGGRSSRQQTEIVSAAPPSATSIAIRNSRGFKDTGRNFLVLGREVISYEGITGNVLLNVRRGLLGTSPTQHGVGTPIGQAQRLYAKVKHVSGTTITLDKAAAFPVLRTHVYIGSVGMSIQGFILDGNRRPEGSASSNPSVVQYQLSRWVSILNNRIVDGDHSGVSFDLGTSESTIQGNSFVDNGDPQHLLGAAIMVFRGSSRNLIRENKISGKTLVGVLVDDRTDLATEFDASSNGNNIEANTISLNLYGDTYWNAAVAIESSSFNSIVRNRASKAHTGIHIAMTEQGSSPGDARHNKVRDNDWSSHQVGINVSGSNNSFVDNAIDGTRWAIVDTGKNNNFTGTRTS